MAVKQEIKYKVRKIDGTDVVEGTISLNVKKEGARYLLHRAVVAQSNKSRQGTASTKTRSEVSGGGKNLGSRKVLVMLDLDLAILHYGQVVEYHLVQSQGHMNTRLISKKDA